MCSCFPLKGQKRKITHESENIPEDFLLQNINQDINLLSVKSF